MKDTPSIKIPVLILGAGMAGLGAGVEAQRRGLSSLILEADSRVGGLCKNTTVLGCDFDFGPKILILDNSKNSEDILNFLGEDYDKCPMRESVYTDEFGMLSFPLQRNLIDLPEEQRATILSEIETAQTKHHAIRSYGDWLKSNYGSYLSEKILIPYEEKKWQTSLDNLDYKWALSRPVKVDFDEMKKGANTKLPPNRHYYYPKTGNISILSENIARKSGELRLNSRVNQIDLCNKFVVADDQRIYYEKLVSTLPLDYALSITRNADERIMSLASKATLLKRLSIRVYNLVFKGNFNLEGTAIYFPERGYIFRRVSILENLCPALRRKGLTPISVEVSLSYENERTPAKTMSDLVVKQLLTIPQFKQLGMPIASEVLEIDFAYPLQTKGLGDYVKRVHDAYKQYGVYHCGRGGNFDYCNSDLAYLQGKEIVAKIASHINSRSIS